MKTRLTVIVLGALVALVAIGAGRGTKPVQAKTAVDRTTVPAGVYTTTIVPADIPPEFPPEAIPILVGDWQIEISEDGGSTVTKDGEVVVLGHYTFSKTHVVATDDDGPLACFDAQGIATGVYTWKLQNDELTLTPVLDRCLGREIVTTAHPLQKQ